ncbi:VTT domain-containing protein [Lentilactobacillus sp. G22-6]|uniref:TVP38/TMEM64 family protein n=1 Tax=Lentilactobacillus dabitei TaxID=2831523 RepID=UPI001C25888E|nr:VTT domain-containing protein [Lentilactobacillus dabitei]MBU9790046.1 VTT domain-containing protein [Lentilactobacillus dabitei]
MKKHFEITSLICAAILGCLLLVFLVMRFEPKIRLLFNEAAERQWIISHFQSSSPIDLISFSLLIILFSVIPGFPASIIGIVAGICFGHWLGFMVNVIGITMGNFIAATFLNTISNHWVKRRPNRLYADLINMRHPKLGVVIGYSIPFIPSMLINVAATDLKFSPPQLFSLCLIGSLAVSALYSFSGDALFKGNFRLLALLLVLMAALVTLIRVIHIDRKQDDVSSFTS